MPVPTFFYMLVGAPQPASGKSTWAEQFRDKFAIVSSDAIRAALYGDESIQGNPVEVFELAKQTIVDVLKQGNNVIFDATNMKYKNRMNIMREVNKLNGLIKVCEIFVEPIEVLLERNATRERHVPEHIIHRMMRQFEMPTYTEGFDVINIHNEYQIHLNKLLEKANNFDQQNHHHSLSLYDHCAAAKKWIANNVHIDDKTSMIKWDCMMMAALCHDLAKPDVQTFFNLKGIETNEAHYYDHHTLGAYYALMYDEPWGDTNRIYIAQLVCYHMQPYLNKTEDADRRWRERIGNDLWEDVLVIHKADVAAH